MRARLRRTGLTAAGLLILAVPSTRADDTTLSPPAPAPAPALDPASVVDGASNCPRPDAVWAELATLIRQEHLEARLRALNVEGGPVAHVVDLGDRYRILAAGLVREYRDPNRDCAYRARVSAVFVALAIDPAELSPEVVPAPPAPVAPAPSPSASASVPVQRAEGCPASGLRFVADEGNAAMGLRAMGLDVINCGEKTRELNGYPAITVLDGSGAPFPEVRTVEGTDKVPMASKDPGPRRLTLAPGESAHASLYWRMHAEDGVYLRVAAKQGEATATIRPPYPLDIGPDNVLGTTAWQPSP